MGVLLSAICGVLFPASFGIFSLKVLVYFPWTFWGIFPASFGVFSLQVFQSTTDLYKYTYSVCAFDKVRYFFKQIRKLEKKCGGLCWVNELV